ncbi:SusC/RagA family TonB-linked outer membrane protein [Membranicola marinus]|uniref:SusC/RagA family TonB-linked outer membrane protein n=1 Tax=Membranihabitans marinus TaxID=1227546 RepID=A0A953HUZ7_9BACT|nr:SusC/RagA family TonB-linked outer membrane protein [Membranihabitans marinus]MBY5958780.1 SusC/RagA family TonB-linked outer membrane protein [Membranihabitans marinus]
MKRVLQCVFANLNFWVGVRWGVTAFILFWNVLAGISQTSIEGTVKDEEGDPLIGATILEKGTTNGTVTDLDGRFVLEDVDEDGTVTISYTGMKSSDYVVAEVNDWNIVLETADIMLDEIQIVAVGYGTLDKKELTTAVTHIDSKDFLQTSSINPMNQIQGKVAGVNIQNTAAADPNAGPSIQIRGVGSRNAGNAPLVIIDGIPGGSLSNIDNNDIASIDVLKGGAASAIYGTRASNGVIIVTTKKGKAGQGLQVNYNGYLATDVVKNIPEVLSPEEFLEKEIARDEGARTDWADKITRATPLWYNHSLALSNATENTSYRASAQYRNAEGIDIATNRNEFGARLNVRHTALNDQLEFTLNAAPRFTKEEYTNYGAFSQAIQLNPTLPVFEPDNPGQYAYFAGFDTYNPVEELLNNERGGERKYFSGSATAQWNITKNLNTSVMYAYQNDDRLNYWFSPSNSARSISSNRRGEAERRYDVWKDKVFEWTGNYSLYKRDFTVRLLGGYSYQYNNWEYFRAKNYDFPSDALSYNDLDQGSYLKEGRAELDSDQDSWKLIAFFGRFTGNYLERYYFTASLRREGSSKFGENNKWGWFPGLSAAWRISEESFMDDQVFFDELKIRADYGVTGNQGFSPYQAVKLYTGAGQYYIMGNWVKGFGPGNNYNPNLAWEEAVNYNAGIDFTILNSKISGSIDLYNRESRGLVGNYDVPVPPNIHPQTFVNVGTIRNTGAEISLDVFPVHSEDFEYSLGLVAATNNNKLVSFSNDLYEQGQVYLKSLPSPGNPGPVILMEEGGDIGSFYMFKHAGFDENGDFLIYKKGENGEFTNEKISATGAGDDQKYHAGSGIPKLTASLSNRFRYKNFDLNLYFRGAFGHKILNLKNMYYGLKAFEGVNLLRKAYFPTDHGIQTHQINDSKKVTDYFLQKGDFVKLDVATIGYTFDPIPGLKNLRLYLSARELLTLTRYDGIDPDQVPTNGLEPGVEEKDFYPDTRNFTFGLQLTF